MSRWLTIVFGLLAIGGVFFLFRSMMVRGDANTEVQAQTVPTLAEPVLGPGQGRDGMKVFVRRSTAEMRPMYISLNGRTDASRIQEVVARMAGAVTAAPALQGRKVKQGEVLCEQDARARDARRREADAAMKLKEQEYQNAQERLAKGWVSEAWVAKAKASYDTAKANYAVADAEWQQSRLTAPFPGIFERRAANVGDYLAPGQACGTLVALDPIRIRTEIDEASAAQVKLESLARWTLADGTYAPGKVSYIARTPNPQTHAYPIEIAIDNPDNRISVGQTGVVRVQVDQVRKHKVPRGALWTDPQGRIWVRHVDPSGRVAVVAVDFDDEEADGVWIGGLPDPAVILTEGQKDALPGLRVTTVSNDGSQP